MGNKISPGARRNSGMRGHPVIHPVASSNTFKKTEHEFTFSHLTCVCMFTLSSVLSTVRKGDYVTVQSRPAGCIHSCTNTSKQQEVLSVCFRKQNLSVPSLHFEMTRIFEVWGTQTVDMFATVHNVCLPQFMSLVLEPLALAVDALSQDWQGRSMYMYVSAVSSDQQSHSETTCHSGGGSDPTSPMVAITTVVSTSALTLCGPPSVLSIPPSVLSNKVDLLRQ